VTGDLPPLPSPDEFRALLREPESTTLEFKSDLPSPQEVQRLVAAFANTDGGTLVIGPHPLATEEWAKDVADWAREVTPRPRVRITPVGLGPQRRRQDFVIVQVARGDQGPYLAEGQALERRDDRVVPMTAQSIASAVEPPGLDRARDLPDLRRLADVVAGQSTKIEQQLTTIGDLSQQMHWTRQLPIRAATAMLGAGVGYVLGVWNPL
jgi:hypothetical protein